jgi:hypothetical protein
MTTADFRHGGYRYIPAVFQYSAGAQALPGYQVQRVRFMEPMTLKAGFRRIADIIQDAGRPLTSFCACELRSPAPFDDAGFKAFNEIYVKTLAEWGIYNDRVNPVARSNVCPEIGAPPEPSFHAFCFTTEATTDMPTFAIAGSGEAMEGEGPYRDRTVRYGDTSEDGMREKARHVLGEMERRLAAFGLDWNHTTASQVYTVYDLFPFFADEIVRRGAARHGLTWHLNRPPVRGLDYEMDTRGIAVERVI